MALPFSSSFLIAACLVCSSCFSQQVPDTAFTFENRSPAFPLSAGPLILIDEAHNNFHTCNGGFTAFARLLRGDGYKVSPSVKTFSAHSLRSCSVLVISNALHDRNVNDWTLPTPSAFGANEITALTDWIRAGGSLLLIADHMPFAGAAQELGKALGFTFQNGFARTGKQLSASVFSKRNGMLMDSPVSMPARNMRAIDSVVTFTGSSFTKPPAAIGVLKFLPGHVSLCSDTAWIFNAGTVEIPLSKHFQGAIMEFGKGRVAVFGEAAMFTAQVSNGKKVGLNSPRAPQNAAFVLNVLHWLTSRSIN